jgi:hypothetical protein
MWFSYASEVRRLTCCLCVVASVNLRTVRRGRRAKIRISRLASGSKKPLNKRSAAAWQPFTPRSSAMENSPNIAPGQADLSPTTGLGKGSGALHDSYEAVVVLIIGQKHQPPAYAHGLAKGQAQRGQDYQHQPATRGLLEAEELNPNQVLDHAFIRGNRLPACSDTEFGAAGMRKLRLSVHSTPKLNRSHLPSGEVGFIGTYRPPFLALTHFFNSALLTQHYGLSQAARQ